VKELFLKNMVNILTKVLPCKTGIFNMNAVMKETDECNNFRFQIEISSGFPVVNLLN
jgi:hypothetical protein